MLIWILAAKKSVYVKVLYDSNFRYNYVGQAVQIDNYMQLNLKKREKN